MSAPEQFIPDAKPRINRWLILGLTILFCTAGISQLASISDEAITREAICLRLLGNNTEGRQALISSAWWAPLPTLLRLPIVCASGDRWPGLSSLVVSSIMGALLIGLIELALHSWNMKFQRHLLVAGLGANPLFIEQCLNGSSNTTILFFSAMVAYCFSIWIARRKLRALVLFAIAAGLLLITSFETASWLILVILLLVIDQCRRKSSDNETEAVLTLGLLPIVYSGLLWILMNWLIMGDPFYFLRSFATTSSASGNVMLEQCRVTGPYVVFCIIPLLLVIFSAIARDGNGLTFGIMAFAPILCGLLFSHKGMLWPSSGLLHINLVLGILSLGYLLCVSSVATKIKRARHILAIIPLLLSLLTYLMPSPTLADRPAAVTGWLDDLKMHVKTQHDERKANFIKIYVCGYDSFRLLKGLEDPMLLHSLDLDFSKAVTDYPGHQLYILVSEPIGRKAMDSIHWKHNMLFEQGEDVLLYDSDWHGWRLFEIIQTEKPKPNYSQ